MFLLNPIAQWEPGLSPFHDIHPWVGTSSSWEGSSTGGDMDAEIFSDEVSSVLKHVTAAKVLEIRWSAHLERPLLAGFLCRCMPATPLSSAARGSSRASLAGRPRAVHSSLGLAWLLPQKRPAEQRE